jgi:hypothetical protein
MNRDISEKESFDFWFNNSEFDEHDQFGSKYYVNDFYREIVSNLDIPKDGFIVVAGTHKAVSFNILCDMFGSDRCIGFDLYNPSEHNRVFTKDCLSLSEKDNIPIAFAHNDVGSLSHTPDVKIHAHKWLTGNIVPGGYLMGNNNLNRAKFKFEEYMTENGFTNTHFLDLDENVFDISSFPIERIEGYMISRKLQQ